MFNINNSFGQHVMNNQLLDPVYLITFRIKKLGLKGVSIASAGGETKTGLSSPKEGVQGGGLNAFFFTEKEFN